MALRRGRVSELLGSQLAWFYRNGCVSTPAAYWCHLTDLDNFFMPRPCTAAQVVDQETQKAMMAFYYKKQEEQKVGKAGWARVVVGGVWFGGTWPVAVLRYVLRPDMVLAVGNARIPDKQTWFAYPLATGASRGRG